MSYFCKRRLHFAIYKADGCASRSLHHWYFVVRQPIQVRSRRNFHRSLKSDDKATMRLDDESFEQLGNSWAVIGAVERGPRINKLVSVGCSKCGLGKDLDIPESSIRRHAEIAELSECHRKAINSGLSAKKMLIAKKEVSLRREMLRRIDQDTKTGALSDEVASIILGFCRIGYRLRKQPMVKAMFPILLDNVGSYLRQVQQPCYSIHRSSHIHRRFVSLRRSQGGYAVTIKRRSAPMARLKI